MEVYALVFSSTLGDVIMDCIGIYKSFQSAKSALKEEVNNLKDIWMDDNLEDEDIVIDEEFDYTTMYNTVTKEHSRFVIYKRELA